MWQNIIDILGWIGAAAYLVAYALVSMKKLSADSTVFQGLNMLGGILLVVNSAFYRAWPSVALNMLWIGIAVFVVARKVTSSHHRGIDPQANIKKPSQDG